MNQTVRAYLTALEAADLEGMVSLFTEDAWVLSPFLGRMPARNFFQRVIDASAATRLTVHDVLVSAEGHPRAIGYFLYDWWLLDGSRVSFDCADVFDFDPESGRIRSMTILYDTHMIRTAVGDKYG